MTLFKPEQNYKLLHRFAVLTASVAVGLIIAGATVTSTGSGDAVPDWPLSYGTLAPPMIGGILFEHTHRLVAGFTGLLIAALAIGLWVANTERKIKWLGTAALGAVLLQATLGGLRVLLISNNAVQEAALHITGASSVSTLRMAIAVTHAFLAQTIICILFSIAIFTSRSWQNSSPVQDQIGKKIHRAGILLAGFILGQLILGALVRHSGAGLIIPDFPLSFGKIIPPFANLPHNPYAPFPLSPEAFTFKVAIHFSHRLLALVILATVVYMYLAFRATPRIAGQVKSLLLLTTLQILLGALNIWTAKAVLSTVLHVAVGALLLANSVALVMRARRIPLADEPARKPSQKILAYLELTKPRLTLLVVFSALTGYYLGSTGSIDILPLLNALLGIGLASGGALALNQYAEREHDAKMERTQKRPLPTGRLKPGEALGFGVLLCAIAVLHLAIAVNLLTASLVAATILSYLLAYTPLKRKSYLNTAVGAISGALPIVCGWAASRNALGAESLVLFGILFFWQFPHFLSIALLYREDYRKAGYKMLPNRENGIRMTNRHIILACLALVGVSLLPAAMGLTGKIYVAVALLAGGGFLLCGISAALYKTNVFARRLMFASFAYPLLVWGFLMFDKLGM